MKAIVIAGRTGKDAEMRRTGDGTPVLSFSVAVTDGWGDKARTLWFECSLFGKRGENLQPLLPKATAVTVSGDLSTREHAGKTYLTIRVNEVTLQGGKPAPAQSQSRQQSYADQSGGGYGTHADLDGDEIPFLMEWR